MMMTMILFNKQQHISNQHGVQTLCALQIYLLTYLQMIAPVRVQVTSETK